MRRGRAAERRARWATLLLVAAGVGLLLWSPWAPGRSVFGQAAPAGAAPPGGVVPAAAAGPIVPTRLVVPAIGVDAPVESRGTVRSRNPFTGQVVDGFGVPESMTSTSWWSDGPRPGSAQMAVVLGHEQVGGGYGVFNRLDQLHPGDDVLLRDRTGASLHFRVLQAPLTGLSKSTSALADALDAHPAAAGLALVTCGGRFDPQARQSQDNTVVFAALVPGG